MPASDRLPAGCTREWLALFLALGWCGRIAREVYKGDPKAAEVDARSGKWPLLWAWALDLPASDTLPTAWVALWIGDAGVPGWPLDGGEMRRWGSLLPVLDELRPLALRILARRFSRLGSDDARTAARLALLAAVKLQAESQLDAIRVHLHRELLAVEVEQAIGNPPGWKTGHLIAAARADDLAETLASRHRPRVRALRAMAKG